MSFTYTTKVTLGVRLTEEQLKDKAGQLVFEGCKHITEWKEGLTPFCSQCGAEIRLQKIEHTSWKHFIYDKEEDEDPQFLTPNGLPTRLFIKDAGEGSENGYFVGLHAEHDPRQDGTNRLDYFHGTAWKEAIKQVLEPYSLWNEADYGLWLWTEVM